MRLVHLLLLLPLFLLGCSDTQSTPVHSQQEEQTETIIHPAFSITETQLQDSLTSLPTAIREKILSRPQCFLELIRQVLLLPEDFFRLVDKQHSLSPEYEPKDLVSLNLYDISVNRQDLFLRRSIMPDVLAMTEAARIEGIELLYSSAYRSYEYQKSVYNRHVEQMGKEEADKVSAQPGKSQHQLGTTIDFGSITPAFANTEAGRWLKQNARHFGFSLSYPEGMEALTGYNHEIWHYRYITRVGTELEQQFFLGIQHYMLTFLMEQRRFFEQSRTTSPLDSEE